MWTTGSVEPIVKKRYSTAYNIMPEAKMSLEKVVSNSVVIVSKFKD